MRLLNGLLVGILAVALTLPLLPTQVAAQEISKHLQGRFKKLDKVIPNFVNKFNKTGDMRKFEALVKKLDQRGKYVAEAEKRHGTKHPEVIEHKKAQAEMEKTHLAACEAKLIEVLADAKPPADVYKGGDKAALADIVRKAWTTAHPDDELLGIRFPADAWTRKKVWDYDAAKDAFEKVDRSALWVRVIVKYTDNLAIAYTAYATKDNIAKTTGASVYTKRGHVWDVLLLKNVK